MVLLFISWSCEDFFIKSYVKNLALSLLAYYSLDSQVSRIIRHIVKDNRKFEAQSHPVEPNIFSGNNGLGLGWGGSYVSEQK